LLGLPDGPAQHLPKDSKMISPGNAGPISRVRAVKHLEKGFVVEVKRDKPETLRHLPIPIQIVC
jgi:hypothetical protein